MGKNYPYFSNKQRLCRLCKNSATVFVMRSTALEDKIIPYQKIKEIMKSIPELRTKALFACQYGLGARLGELVQYKHKRKNELFYETTGITKDKINPIIQGGQRVWICNIPNFKQIKITGNVTGKFARKEPYIIEKEKWLFEPFKEWYDLSSGNFFVFRYRRAIQLLKEILPDGMYPHCLRHSRATHLRRIFGLPIEDVQVFLGHSSVETTMVYSKPNISDAVNKISTALVGLGD